VNLTVTDDNGATRTTSRDVTVRNRAPTADFDFGPANPQSGDDITFDASGSSDPDGEIVRYEWNLTDDSGQSFTTSGETVTAGSLDGGTYVMNLTVTDDDGATHSTSETFLVEEDNSPVVENFDARSDNIGQITVNWAVSDPNGDLQSVEIVVSNDDYYSSKPFGISGSSASGSTTFNLLSSGTYDVAITVTDKAGNTDTRSTTVTVSLAGSAPRLGAPLFPSLPGIRLPEATTSARFVS
jgi:chitinase